MGEKHALNGRTDLSNGDIRDSTDPSSQSRENVLHLPLRGLLATVSKSEPCLIIGFGDPGGADASTPVSGSSGPTFFHALCRVMFQKRTQTCELPAIRTAKLMIGETSVRAHVDKPFFFNLSDLRELETKANRSLVSDPLTVTLDFIPFDGLAPLQTRTSPGHKSLSYSYLRASWLIEPWQKTQTKLTVVTETAKTNNMPWDFKVQSRMNIPLVMDVHSFWHYTSSKSKTVLQTYQQSLKRAVTPRQANEFSAKSIALVYRIELTDEPKTMEFDRWACCICSNPLSSGVENLLLHFKAVHPEYSARYRSTTLDTDSGSDLSIVISVGWPHEPLTDTGLHQLAPDESSLHNGDQMWLDADKKWTKLSSSLEKTKGPDQHGPGNKAQSSPIASTVAGHNEKEIQRENHDNERDLSTGLFISDESTKDDEHHQEEIMTPHVPDTPERQKRRQLRTKRAKTSQEPNSTTSTPRTRSDSKENGISPPSRSRDDMVSPRTTKRIKRIKRKFRVPAAPEGVTFFSSTTKRPLMEGDDLSESDDEVDDRWLRQKHDDEISNSHELTTAEKAFMKLFNSHISTRKSTADYFFADMWRDLATNNAAALRGDSMLAEFVKRAALAKLEGLLDDDTIIRAVDSIRLLPPATVDVGSLQPSVSIRNWSTGCICGKDVNDVTDCVICTNAECTNPDFHLPCVGLRQKPDEWLCQTCQEAVDLQDRS